MVSIAGFVMAGGGAAPAAGGSQASGSQASAKKIIMRVANVWGPTHPNSRGVDNIFKPQIEKKTNGATSVEVYHSGVLGNEQTLWDSVRNGSIEVGILGALFGTEYKPLLICDWPFLYRDIEHSKKTWTGSVGEEFMKDFNTKYASQMNILSIGPNSARTFTSNKKLTSFDDFKGQKFRMPGTVVHTGIVADLGGSAQVIPLTDLFNALQTGVVDGQDNGMVTVLSEKFYEVQKFLYETNHIVAIMPTVIHAPFLNSLSADQQKIIRDAAKEASIWAWDEYMKSLDNDRKKLRELGMTITACSESDRAKINEAIQPTLKKMLSENNWAYALMEKVKNVK